mgnify:CR=1 FL=1
MYLLGAVIVRGCTVNTSHQGEGERERGGGKENSEASLSPRRRNAPTKSIGDDLTSRHGEKRHLSRPIIRDSLISRLRIPRDPARLPAACFCAKPRQTPCVSLRFL